MLTFLTFNETESIQVQYGWSLFNKLGVYVLMHIANFIHTKAVKAPTEYTVYAYHKYCEDAIGYNKWQYVLNGKNSSEVLREAERLFKTDEFQKIEIKKKFFDIKKKRHFVSTFRVLDNHPERKSLIAVAITLLVLSCSGLFILELL